MNEYSFIKEVIFSQKQKCQNIKTKKGAQTEPLIVLLDQTYASSFSSSE